MGWHSSFANRVKVTIDNTKVSSDLTDFPVRLDLSSAAGTGSEDLARIFDALAFEVDDPFETPDSGAFDTDRWEVTGQSANVTNTADALNCNADSGDIDGERQGVLSLFTLDCTEDFDVEVAFDITAGAATNGWSAMLEVYFFDQAGGAVGGGPSWGSGAISRRRYDNTNGHSFEGICYEGGTPKTVQRDSATSGDTTGKLRIVYDASAYQLTCYYDKGSGWVAHTAFTMSDADNKHAKICINVYTTGSLPTIVTDFTNFKVNQGKVIWPDGHPNAQKIAVTTDDGTTECYVEIERYDETNKIGILHTKVPSVSSSEDTVIYLYYDPTAGDNTTYVGYPGDAAAQNVWDSDFAGVWHLSQNPGDGTDGIIDSTGNANHGTPAGSMTAEDLVDVVDGAQGLDFDGSNDVVNCGNDTSLDTDGDYTLEAIFEGHAAAANEVIAGRYDDGANNGFALRFQADETIYGIHRQGGANTLCVSAAYASGYHHVAFTFEEGVGGEIFVDGASEDTDATTTTAISTHTQDFVIAGQDYGTPREFAGEISEVRLSMVQRSDAWILATYNSLFGTLVSYTVEDPAWLSGFNNRIRLTVDSSLIDADLTDFPIRLVIGAQSGIEESDLTQVIKDLGSNKLKMAATIADGKTQCYVEIETWDDTNNEGALNIKLPTVASGSDTVFFLYWDAAGADNSTYVGVVGSTPGQSVWDNNFEAVYHLSEDPSGGADAVKDSTGNARHLTSVGTMTTGDLVDGLQGAKSIDFEGTDDGLYDNVAPLIVTPYTLEGVAKRTDSGAYTIIGIVDKDVANHMFGIAFRDDGGGGSDDVVSSWGYTSGDGWVPNLGSTLTSADTYYHVAGVFNSGTDREVFMNGVSDGTDATSLGAPSNIDRICVGYLGDSTPGSFMKGNISEARISSVARSDAWIKATYYSLFDALITASIREDWVPGFNNRIEITIDSDLVDATLTDFPVLIRLAEGAGISNKDVSRIFTIVGADANRKKIAITTSDGITQCPVEIDFWDTENEIANLWTKVPSVSSAADTVIYLYFDGSVEDNIENVGDTGDEAAQEVWDEDFEAVWHMSQDPTGGAGCMLDSTANERNGTPTGSMTAADLVDMTTVKGLDLDGTDDQFQFAGQTDFSGNEEITVEAFFKSDATDDNCLITQDDGTGTSSDLFNLYIESTELRFGLRTDAAGWEECVLAFSDTTNENYCAGKKPTGTDYSTLFLNDGTSQDDSTNTFDMRTTAGSEGNVGVQTGNDARDFNGQIGEVRMSSVARSDAWLKATNHTLKDTLITWGDYEQRDFKKYRKFTIDSDLIDEDLTDFPIALPLSTSAGIDTTDLSDLFAELAYPADDDFYGIDGEDPDAARWTQTGGTPTLSSNKLYHTVTGALEHARGNFFFEGDFDIEVEFAVSSGPATNTWELGFRITDDSTSEEPDDLVHINRRYSSAQQISANRKAGGSWDTVATYATSATSGKFRIVRSGDNVTTYYDVTGGGWTQLGGNWDVSGFADRLFLYFYWRSATGNPVCTGTFDNFKVNSGIYGWLNGEPNRKKIKVTTGDLETQCYVEVEHLDCGNEVGMLHVKVPHVDASADTELYLHYDADQPDNDAYVGDPGDTVAQNVWDADFLGVWHMADLTTSTIQESTSNNHTSTKGSASNPTETDGLNGKGQEFDATSEQISVGDIDIDGPGTVEAIVNPDTLSAVMSILSKINSGGANSYFDFSLRVNASGQVQIETGDTSSQQTFNATTLTLSTATWQYVAGKADGTNLKAFLDAASESVAQTVIPAGNAEPYEIGNTPYYTQGFDGIIDEVRMSSVARSDAWMKATYYTLTDAIGTWDAAQGAWLGTFAYRRKVTVDKDVIDGLLKNFPMAFNLDATAGIGSDDVTGIFTEITTANAKKIAITARDGRNQLFTEIENWDSSNSKGMIHIKAPEIFFNKDTEFYIYYDSNQDDNTDWIGDPGDTPAMAVWDADFAHVFHMTDNAAMVNSVDGVAVSYNGTLGETDGPNGGLSLQADADGENVQAPSHAFTTTFTIESQALIDSGGDSPSYDCMMGREKYISVFIDSTVGGQTWGLHLGNGSSWDTNAFADTDTVEDTWYVFGVRYNAGDLDYFLDGVDDGGGSVTSRAVTTTYQLFDRQNGLSADYRHHGKIAEFRVSTICRTDEWIAATVYSLTDALVTWGSEEQLEAGADVNVPVGTPSIAYTAQAATVGIAVDVGTPGITYTPQAASTGMGVDVGTPGITYEAKQVEITQNLFAIGVMSKPVVSSAGPGATATGRQPGATADGAGPSANVTGKGE